MLVEWKGLNANLKCKCSLVEKDKRTFFILHQNKCGNTNSNQWNSNAINSTISGELPKSSVFFTLSLSNLTSPNHLHFFFLHKIFYKIHLMFWFLTSNLFIFHRLICHLPSFCKQFSQLIGLNQIDSYILHEMSDVQFLCMCVCLRFLLFLSLVWFAFKNTLIWVKWKERRKKNQQQQQQLKMW